jgi:LDH2 family malate/lactate/ureidoglycolate dehydrogenase
VNGEEQVLIPGDPEREMEENRMKAGIPILPVVEEDLKFLGEKMGIELSLRPQK